jgi:hypothetical protein
MVAPEEGVVFPYSRRLEVWRRTVCPLYRTKGIETQLRVNGLSAQLPSDAVSTGG